MKESILYADGVTDDTEALKAFIKGEDVVDANGNSCNRVLMNKHIAISDVSILSYDFLNNNLASRFYNCEFIDLNKPEKFISIFQAYKEQ
jgi:hypothetical protein